MTAKSNSVAGEAFIKRLGKLLGKLGRRASAVISATAATSGSRLSTSRPSYSIGATASSTLDTLDSGALDTLERTGSCRPSSSSSPRGTWTFTVVVHGQPDEFIGFEHGRVIQGRQELRAMLVLVLMLVLTIVNTAIQSLFDIVCVVLDFVILY